MSHLARRVVLSGLEGLEEGRLTLRDPDGSARAFGGPPEDEESDVPVPAAEIQVRDQAFYRRLLLRGQVGAGASFIRGEWGADRLADAVVVAARNRSAFRRASPLAWVGGIADRMRHFVRANSPEGSRRNIHAHYDLGNDFFASFLDPSLTYSCALFEGEETSLEAAQRAKHRRIADLAGIGPGDRVLDVGCGWGAFAEYAARERGCHVTGITISRRQLEYARRRMERAGVADRVQVLDRDYRELSGTYDRVVSIEMLEAVGHRHLPEFFRACHRVLRPGGRAAIQVITVPDQKYTLYRLGTDFIRCFVFPGSHLPSLGALLDAASSDTSFRIRRVRSLAPHYVETLRRWRRRFEEEHGDRAGRPEGLDGRLYRLWRFYLAYCEAGFRTDEIDDLQLVLERPAPRAGRTSPGTESPA